MAKISKIFKRHSFRWNIFRKDFSSHYANSAIDKIQAVRDKFRAYQCKEIISSLSNVYFYAENVTNHQIASHRSQKAIVTRSVLL